MGKLITQIIKHAAPVRRALVNAAAALKSRQAGPALKAAMAGGGATAVAAFLGLSGDEAAPEKVLDRLAGASDQVIAAALQEVFASVPLSEARSYCSALLACADTPAARAALGEIVTAAETEHFVAKHTGDGADIATSMTYDMFQCKASLIKECMFHTGLDKEALSALRAVLHMDQNDWEYIVKRI